MIDPERLADIQELGAEHVDCVDDPCCVFNELLAHVDELTRQRDDARGMVIASRYFQNTQDEWYEPAYPTDELPAIGPVAWDEPRRMIVQDWQR